MNTHYIKQSLLEHGRELFSNYGLQKTTISDITKKVGIASGTFYNYFSSKEELYFEILEREEAIIMEQLLNVAFEKGGNPKETLQKQLQKAIHTIETNPLIRQLYFENNLNVIMSKLPPERLEKHIQQDAESLLPVIEQWQKAGMIVNEDAEKLAGVLRALFVLTLHEKEIGEDVYKATIAWYIERIVEGMIK